MIRALLLLTSFVFADIAVEPFGAVYHWDRDKDYNENIKYVSVAYRYEQFDIGVATFENSHYRRSNFAYVGYRHPINEYFGVFVNAGYVTGYNNTNILGGAGVYGEYKNTYIKLTANPKYMGATVGYIFKGF